jgi:hypothetical protein
MAKIKTDITPQQLRAAGIDFKLERSGKHWQLRHLTKGRWESLSIWSTRAEAMLAADMFIPGQP